MSHASRGGAGLVVAAVGLAALSLLAPYALAFDPWAWVVWGREAGRLALDTSSGPSWKPFPVLFTTLFAPLGDPVAPALWLVVARAGGLLALAGAFALADRLAGRWAGIAAVGVMALSPWWAFNTALGNSEGLLAAAVLWAVVAHLAGRRRAALALLTAAALMRPEAWPFLGAYGYWLWRDERRFVIAAGATVLALWFGPDVIGAGGALGASKTGRGVPSPGSAKLAEIPVLALLWDTVILLTVPAVIAAAFARGRNAALIALGAAAWVAVVAVMTVAGFAGNPRYLVAAVALGTALAGAGAVRAATAIAGRVVPRSREAGTATPPAAASAPSHEAETGTAPAAASAAPHEVGTRWSAAATAARRPAAWAAPLGALVLLVAVFATTVDDLRRQGRELDSRVEGNAEFDGVITAAGGRDALLDCSRVRTSNRARSLVAWKLDLPMRDLDATPERPSVVIRARWYYGMGLEPPRYPGYRVLATAPYWQVAVVCGPAPQVVPEDD